MLRIWPWSEIHALQVDIVDLIKESDDWEFRANKSEVQLKLANARLERQERSLRDFNQKVTQMQLELNILRMGGKVKRDAKGRFIKANYPQNVSG